MNKTIEQVKDEVARTKRYPNWKEMENWIIDHNMPVNVAVLLVSAMEEVAATLQQSHAVSGDVDELAKEFANDIIGSLDWLDIYGQTYWSNVYEGFKSGYAAAPQKGMRWVKATNAPIDGSYYCRFYNNGYIVMRGTCVVTDGKFNSDYDLNDIEWLDESPSDK